MIDLVYERQWSSLGNLVSTLQAMKRMGHLYGGFPRFRYERSGIPREILRTFPATSIWNFGMRRLKAPNFFLLNEPRWIGEWVARHEDLAPTIIANGTAHRYLFPKIKDSGRLLILERGSTHPVDLYLKPQQARKEAGFAHSFELPEAVIDEVDKTNLADFILAGSELIKRSYVARGYPSEKIKVASYGVDTDRFLPSEDLRVQKRPVRLGIVGIVSFRKGIFRALRIGEWALKVGIQLELHFVGPLFDLECQQLIKRSGANCVFHGVIKGPSLVSFLQSCDAVCLPSYEDGFGVSVLEGMSVGLPAIVSAEAGCSEAITPGVNGVILEHFDDAEFDDQLGALLRNRDSLKQMGVVARQTVVENYQAVHSMARIQDAIHSILKSSKASR